MRSANHLTVGAKLHEEIHRKLRLWLILSLVASTLVVLSWTLFTFADGARTAKRVVSNIVNSRVNTFSEVFLQRDLERFLSTQSGSLLTPLNVQVMRGKVRIASLGKAPTVGLRRHWELDNPISGEPLFVEIGLDLLPILSFYLAIMLLLFLFYRTLLGHTLKSFGSVLNAITGEMNDVIAEMRGNPSTRPRSSLQDIDEIRRLSVSWKQQLERYQTEVEALSTAAAESRVARSVAHDIKSPLSVLRLLLGSQKPIGEQERELLMTASDHITKITDDLVRISRRKLSGHSTPQSFDALALRQVWESLAQEKSIEYANQVAKFSFTSEWNKQDFIVCKDSAKLRRTLSNLINNSLNAGKSQPTHLQLLLRRNDGLLSIQICDNGPGIPPHILSQLSENPISENGTGLGISSAFRWIRDEGQEMTIISDGGAVGTIVAFNWTPDFRSPVQGMAAEIL